MTRIRAILLSHFGPLIPAFVILLFFAALDEPSNVLVGVGVAIYVSAAVFLRIYFAVWYARDKGRSGALGLFALFGVLGWLFLIITDDRKRVETAARAESNGAVV